MKKVKVNFKNKKGILIIIASIIAIIILGIGVFFGIKQFFFKDQPKENKLIIIDNLDVEVNSEINLLSFIKDNKDIEILSKDERVDTSTLGSKELVIKYLDNKKEKEYKFKINIIDTMEPIMKYPEEISITKGEEVDLLQDVKVIDNSKEEITPTIEGEYDINTPGTYNLKFIALDSSNNKCEGPFTLIVSEKKTSSNTTKKTTTTTSSKTTTGTNKNTSSNDYVDFDSMSDEEFLKYFDDIFHFSEILEEEEKNNTPSTNSGSSTQSNTETNNTTTPSTNNKKDDYGHGPIVGSEILDVITELSEEKYGVKIYKETHPYVNIYEDGYRENGSFTKTKVDFSGYNATTNDLRSEAESLVNKNWSIYEEHLTYVNSYRAAVGASPLTLDRNMSIAATIRALEMAYTNNLDHTRPNKTQCFTIFDEMGLGGTDWGENIAAGDSTAKDVAESWKSSPGHYANMINKSFTKIGIGMTYLQGTTYGYYWAQLFAN